MNKYTFIYLTMVTIGICVASYLGHIDWTVFDKLVQSVNSLEILK